MRELKFRAWDKCLNKMRNSIEIPSDYTERNGELDLLNMFQSLGQRYDFMQSTGLRDKNGVEIYEGDIGEDEKGKRYLFKWGITLNGFAAFTKETHSNVYSSYHIAQKIKVIGNIHQNPELVAEVQG